MKSSDGDARPHGARSVVALRIDRWLWHARFYRSRGLAQQAVEAGHVQVNGERVRPSRLVRVGDRLRIKRDRELQELDVLAIPERRGPAVEAQSCYAETAQSVQPVRTCASSIGSRRTLRARGRTSASVAS